MPSTGVQRFTRADATSWMQMDERQIFGAELLDESSGAAFSASWWRLGAGVDSVATTPADEVWVVARGSLTVHAEGEMVHLRTGDAMLLPRAAPAVAEAEVDSEFLVVAHPPSWQLDDDAWTAVREGPPAEPPSPLRAPRRVHPAAGPAGENLAGDGFGFDVRVGRAAAGATAPVRPSGPAAANDELVVVTSGALMVGRPGGELRIQEGEAAYLPAGQPADLRAAQDTDVVFVLVTV